MMSLRGFCHKMAGIPQNYLICNPLGLPVEPLLHPMPEENLDRSHQPITNRDPRVTSQGKNISAMEQQESRRKKPRSSSQDSEDSSHRRRSRKYDRSPSPRRSRYRRSRSRDRRSRSSSRDRRRKESSRNQEWKQTVLTQPQPPQGPPQAPPAGGNYAPPVHNQYQGPPPPNTSQPPPPMTPYNQGYNNYGYNYNQGYDYSYQQPASYRSDYAPPNWQGNQVPYNNQQAPPPPTLAPQAEPARTVEPGPPGLAPPAPRPEDVKKEAIAAEMKQQKATLGMQREEYIKKSTALQRELEILRQQCDDITKEGGKDNNRILKENQKLQVEIQNKMKSIHNVIDMLTGIIGDKATVEDLKKEYKAEPLPKRTLLPKDDFPKGKSESPDRSSVSDSDKEAKEAREAKQAKLAKEVQIERERVERERERIEKEREMREMREKRTPEDSKPMYNFVHYDPEMHWCKVCDIFPKTAKEYLNHLHSNAHKETCLERKIIDMPWHKQNGEGTEKEVPYYSGLPTKRTPIKGLQFFISATAWYCKLCDSWIGDLHCASLHLKSKRHSENFSGFVEQNPHWETDWMADREKAFSDEKHKQMQMELRKQKDDELPSKSKKAKKNKKKNKKLKKRKNKSSASDTSSDSDDSFSDSDQDKSRSIRVAMRNKMKASAQAILNEEIDYHGIKLKGHWAQVGQQPKVTPEVQQEADDRQLLNSIRDKLKAKQEEENKSLGNRRQSQEKTSDDSHGQNSFAKKPENSEAWGPKEPPKSFWIKKDEEKAQAASNKPLDSPKADEMPKPHMGFWTKQQVNMSVKPSENKLNAKEPERDRERDRFKDDRDRKWRDDKYSRYDRSDRRRGRGGHHYDDRRKRDVGSPRHDRNWHDSPKRSYDNRHEKERREENNSSNDESKFEKKANELASKTKKSVPPPKKPTLPAAKGKLPFIGRLPLFKKKAEEPKQTDRDIAPLPYQQSKFEDTPRVPSEIIRPPGVVHITKLAGPVTIHHINPNQMTKSQQMKILVAPPPPTLNETKQQAVDMEIEDQSDEVLIEQPIIEQQKNNVQKTVQVPLHPPPPINRPPFIPPSLPPGRPPFPPNHPPFGPRRNAFGTNPPRFGLPPPVRPPSNRPPFVPNQPPQVPNNPSFVQNHPNPPPLPSAEPAPHDLSDIPEPTEKRAGPAVPLPEDLQEALNIIFPKEEVEQKQQQQSDNAMYATMYNILGCVGYGHEYMDQPPPEITQADHDGDMQPGPDDLKMLGIDEGDTIF